MWVIKADEGVKSFYERESDLLQMCQIVSLLLEMCNKFSRIDLISRWISSMSNYHMSDFRTECCRKTNNWFTKQFSTALPHVISQRLCAPFMQREK